MTVDPEGQADETARRTVRVPIRRGDSVFSFDEHVEVDVDNAALWDARLWHDRPPR
ncbi:hypothetical protein [Mycolicibacterium duvalii]|uniref:Uncharacterized protein n=1 Tax=Mycolicibacterium duvalii TaxID=39688 RepID=A0A7I7JYH0_9MYCO|nr:hypothetical protein [Mycolicibacterium duvalii]MCV7368672.1 hypothetical protein [Mycolicibacterium duvalii]BBX16957.1 hypothetical protein MDUV_18170 [Mycolicibacterium duvalii]